MPSCKKKQGWFLRLGRESILELGIFICTTLTKLQDYYWSEFASRPPTKAPKPARKENHQFRGVNNAIAWMLKARKLGHGCGGVFWQAQDGAQLANCSPPARGGRRFAHHRQLDFYRGQAEGAEYTE
jgi:hypothetical protein